jgi:formylmethanofuran dehydrogenase subunit E
MYAIACRRVRDRPPYVESRIATCSKCGEEVYIALSTPVVAGDVILCLQCIDWKEVEEIMPPTPEQLADLEK